MAYTDFNISNNIAGYETEEDRRRREAAGQVQPVSPDELVAMANVPNANQATMQTQNAQPVAPNDLTMQQQYINQHQMAAPPQAQQAPAQQTQQTTTTQPSSDEGVIEHMKIYENIQTDPAKLLNYSQSVAPDWMKLRAKERAATLLNDELGLKTAQKELSTMTPENLANALRQKTEGGNWLKAILFSSLGMEQSAAAEAAKLGIGKEQAVLGTDGNPYMIKTALNGTPIEGYNAKTGQKLTPEELVTVSAAGTRKLDVVGGTYVNDKTGEVGRVVTDQKTGTSYVQTDTGMKPMTGFRPQSSTGTLEDMRVRSIQDLNIKLAGKTMEEKLAILRPYNQQLVAMGIPAVQPSEIGLQIQQVSTNFAQPAGKTEGPIKPTKTVPAKTTQLPSTVSTTTQGAQAPVIEQKGAGFKGRPTLADIEAQKTKQKEEAQEVGTDIGKLKVNQPKAEGNADYLISKVDELTTHPGFQTSVGAKGPSVGFGLWNPPPGTDAADWAARFKEVQGQQFLSAVDNMRGLGALSNQEGEAATKAISRMSQSQSENEFINASNDFKAIVQRGIDRNRIKLGQEPKYNTLAPSVTQPENLSPADRARQELERRKKK